MTDKDNNKKQVDINISLMPDLVDSLVEPSAKTVGNAFNDVVECVGNFVLSSIRKYNLAKEYELKDFEQQLNRKINAIPEENKDTSKIGFTLKALEDSRYQLSEELMRTYFSNLIADTLDSSKNSNFSPKFSDILSNLGVNEAVILEKMFNNTSGFGVIPIVSIRIINNDSLSYSKADSFRILLSDGTYEKDIDIALSLLESSNLIRIDDTSSLKHSLFTSLYKGYIDEHQHELTLYDIHPGRHCEFIEGLIELTPLGKEFTKILFS